MLLGSLRGSRRSDPEGTATAIIERPFLEEMRAVEKLLPIAPDQINRRVLGSHLADADLEAAERLNRMNLRYYESVVRPVLGEWMREAHARRVGQFWGFAVACAALIAGCFLHGTGAYVLFFAGTFGFSTALAAWFGGSAARIGAGLAGKLERRTAPKAGGDA